MTEEEIDNKQSKNKRKKTKKLKTISFDEELVPKSVAETILAKDENKPANIKKHDKNNKHQATEGENKHRKKKKRKSKEIESPKENNDHNETPPKKKAKTNEEQEPESNEAKIDGTSKDRKNKKRKSKEIEHLNEDDPPKKKSKKIETDDEEQEPESSETTTTEVPVPKKKESIRERKRKKFAKLLDEKKTKAELANQEKTLNYLSRWKHSREEWKFEKLKQIWLQQNMFDPDKIPEEFWDTLVEYFANCKGKVRETIIKDALKIIEEDNESEEEAIKTKRARDIVQNLQE